MNMRVLAYRSNDSRAVGSDQSGLVLCLQHVCDANHVVLRDTLSDADHERDLSLQSLLDTSSGERWWDEDSRGIGASCFAGLLHVGKHWLSKMLAASFLWVGAADNVGTIFDGL